MSRQTSDSSSTTSSRIYMRFPALTREEPSLCPQRRSVLKKPCGSYFEIRWECLAHTLNSVGNGKPIPVVEKSMGNEHNVLRRATSYECRKDTSALAKSQVSNRISAIPSTEQPCMSVGKRT